MDARMVAGIREKAIGGYAMAGAQSRAKQ